VAIAVRALPADVILHPGTLLMAHQQMAAMTKQEHAKAVQLSFRGKTEVIEVKRVLTELVPVSLLEQAERERSNLAKRTYCLTIEEYLQVVSIAFENLPFLLYKVSVWPRVFTGTRPSPV